MRKSFFIFLAFGFLLSACTVAGEIAPALPTVDSEATALSMAWTMAAATQTAMVTATYTPLPPTSTPTPTATEIPSTPTAVPIGVAAVNDQYEIIVTYARYFPEIESRGLIFTPTESGGQYLDIGVIVKNLKPDEPVTVSWEDIYIVDQDNQGWYPNYGGSFAPSNNDPFDAATLYLFPSYDLEDLIVDEHPLYLRVVWATSGQRPATYLFGFDTSNLVEVVIP